ncbi:transposase [Plectonema radiosum]|uniref:transposase n=1 Tax=Plectonema radiosum TaxID=945768 RepID=UPI001D148717|nr:transposase [Plectonema radiosum]
MIFKKQVPKLEKPEGKYFITFVTYERLELSLEARQIVLDACKFFHQKKYKLCTAVIMPDHVHFIIQPFIKSETEYWSIGSILHSIKSYSSKQIPKVMLHTGKVWQDGRYEEMIQNPDDLNECYTNFRLVNLKWFFIYG